MIKPYLKSIFLLLTFVFSSISFATPAELACVDLGATPSLMVKITGQYSSTAAPVSLSAMNLSGLSSAANLQFTRATPMAFGMYVVKFDAVKAYNGCYPQSFLDEVSKKLIDSNAATDVEPNRIIHLDEPKRARVEPPLLPQATPTGFNPTKQYDLTANTAAGGIDALGAWNITHGTPSTLVAVMDDGVFANSALTPNLVSSDAVSFVNGLVENTAAPECKDGLAHGTHVTGTVVSSGNEAYGENIYGVAYGARVVPINIFTENCSGLLNDEVNALAWLGGTHYDTLPDAPKVAAVNMSFGSTGSCVSSEQTAINLLHTEGVSIVVAAGNRNVDVASQGPANCLNVIAVASTSLTNTRAPNSNWGSGIAIAAPGVDIYSTTNEGYSTLSGTSMASPHIAGVLALEYAAYPDITPAQALAALKTDPTPPSSGCSAPTTCGVGIVNAHAAVSEAAGMSVPIAPAILVAERNPAQENQAWVTYRSPGTAPVGQSLSAAAFPGSTVTFDADNSRFVISNITTTAATPFTLTVTNTNAVSATSNEITLPVTSGAAAPIAPVLTTAERNPAQEDQAWVSYSSVGTAPAQSLTAAAFPGNAVTYDSANQRFVISGITTDDTAPFTITVTNDNAESATSNQITLPATAGNTPPTAPVITTAVRNPMQLNQAWIYYSSAGTAAIGHRLTLSAPDLSGAAVTYDASNQRFVISDIQTGRATPFTITVTNAKNSSAVSNQIILPGILQ